MTNNTANDNNTIISNNNTPTPQKPSIPTIYLSSIKFELNQDYEILDVFGNLRVWTYIGWSPGPQYETLFIFKRTPSRDIEKDIIDQLYGRKPDGVIENQFGGVILGSYVVKAQNGEYKPILDIKVSYIGESIETLHPMSRMAKWVPKLII